MTDEKYSQRFRRLAGDFYRLLIEYENLDEDADPTIACHKLDCIRNNLTDFMDELDAEILSRLTDAGEVNQMIERATRRLEINKNE